jgi:hypothetical protein
MKDELNEEQRNAVESIKRFIDDPETKEFLVTGPPGTGKTFTIKYALEKEPIKTTYYAAVSHAAKGVLLNSLAPEGSPKRKFYKNQVKTIAQILNKVKEFNSSSEKEEFRSRKGGLKKILSSASIVVIDECSMIENSLREEILKESSIFCKIIWMGDPNQLPPVSESRNVFSEVFRVKDRVELTECMRFSGSLQSVADYYKSYIEYMVKNDLVDIDLEDIINFKPNLTSEECTIVYTSNLTVFHKAAVDLFKSDPFNTRILAYRNSIIHDTNKALRKLFYSGEPLIISSGEQIILNAPFSNGSHTIYNGEVLTVTKVHVVEKKIQYMKFDKLGYSIDTFSLLAYNCSVTRLNGNLDSNQFVEIVHPDYKNKYDDFLESLKIGCLDYSKPKDKKLQWVNYYNVKNAFAEWSYSYAMSTHKSQGQSLENVLVRMDDIFEVKKANSITKLKSLYVAVTRAKKNLIVYV